MSEFMMYGMQWPDLCKAGFTDKIVAEDANYVYEAFAETGTAATSASWCVRRIEKATGSVTWAGGSNDKIYPATDLPALFA